MHGLHDRTVCQRLSWSTYCLLAAMHLSLCGYLAYLASPTRNEAAHLAAGVSHLVFQRFELFRVNPPLVRSVAALPVVITSVETDWTAYSFNPTDRSEDRIGRRFVELNIHRFRFLMMLARWTCIPFSLVGGWVCGSWATRLYGVPSGVMAMMLWFFSPMIIGHASLITPDAHSAAFSVCAMYCVGTWVSNPNWANALRAGLVLGLAELTKFTLLVLYPVIIALWAVYRLQAPRKTQRQKGETWCSQQWVGGQQLIMLLLFSVLVINLGYGFEDTFKPLGSYGFQSQLFTGLDEIQIASTSNKQGNRFAKSMCGSLPVPLPANYVQGIDMQRLDFERGIPSYLRGQWADHGWWYYYLYALAIKEPTGTWCLLVLAVGATILGSGYSAAWADEMLALVPGLMIFVFVSSQTGFSVHSRYVLPALPFLFVWASKVGRVFDMRPFTRKKLAMAASVLLALTWSVGSSFVVYPHSLSCFQELAVLLPTPIDASYPAPIGQSTNSIASTIIGAGPRNGPRHLLDSNIDWGQDLYYLEDWCESHPEAKPISVAYFGNYPLEQSRIESAGYPPPGPDEEWIKNNMDPTTIGPLPGWYAMSVNYIYDRDRKYRYFLHFRPVANAGYSIYIYHINTNEANRVRRDLRLPELPRDWMPLEIETLRLCTVRRREPVGEVNCRHCDRERSAGRRDAD